MQSEELNLNRFTVYQILTEHLHMPKVVAKILSKPLIIEEGRSKKKYLGLLERIFDKQEFFSHVITDDAKSEEWHTANSPRPKEARMGKSKIKSMLICVLTKGESSTMNCPPGETLKHIFYKDVLERQKKRGIRVRPEIANKWMLHYDKALCHSALPTQSIWPPKVFLWFSMSPYSPDLNPCDFIQNRKMFSNDLILEPKTSSVADMLKNILVENFQ